MKKFFLLLVIPLLLYCSQPEPNTTQIKTELQTIIDQQQKAWNEGNIEGFMAYYWNSEDFVFQSGNNRVHGWQALLDRYKKNYSGENMGKLNFSDIDIKILTNNIAYVLGRWEVTRQDSTSEGLFTILFKKLPEGWRIINDHSS